MKFQNIEQLQTFITWCLKNGIKRIKVDKLEVEVSDYALLQDLSAKQEGAQISQTNKEYKPQEDLSEKEYNDLLFHSSR